MNKDKFIRMAQKKIENQIEGYCTFWKIENVPANDVRLEVLMNEYLDAEGNIKPEILEGLKKEAKKEEPEEVVEEELEEESTENEPEEIESVSQKIETPLEKARRAKQEKAQQREQEERQAEEEIKRELENKPKGIGKLRGILRKKPSSAEQDVVWDDKEED